MGFPRQEYWSGVPFPSPMHELFEQLSIWLVRCSPSVPKSANQFCKNSLTLFSNASPDNQLFVIVLVILIIFVVLKYLPGLLVLSLLSSTVPILALFL